MESFVHLRKGTTPRRLHADLDGLKDDELGRGGFTGRTANMYRRDDPTAYRSVGPLRPPSTSSPPSSSPPMPPPPTAVPCCCSPTPTAECCCPDAQSPCPTSSATWTATCCSSCTRGSGVLETEFGPLRYRVGDWVYVPKACTWRQVPDSQSTLLMIQATDEFRVPPPAQLGRHFPFDPSQVVIPDPDPIDTGDGPLRDGGEYEVRLVHAEIDGGRSRRPSTTGTTRWTSKAGAVTTFRSPSTSPTTTW